MSAVFKETRIILPGERLIQEYGCLRSRPHGASGVHVKRRNDVDNNGERTRSGRGARSGNAILITFFTSPRLSPDAVSLERKEIGLLNVIHPPLKLFSVVG